MVVMHINAAGAGWSGWAFDLPDFDVLKLVYKITSLSILDIFGICPPIF